MNMHVSTAKFKVGDRVRCDDNRGAPASYKVGEVYEVESVDGDMVRCVGKGSRMYDHRFSLAAPTFKIGDRVQGAELEPDDNPGMINGFNGERYSVTWDSDAIDAKYYMWAAEDLYLLPVAAALKIEAGKFYKTRDGRKVGPMEENIYGQFLDKSRSITGYGWYRSGIFIEGATSHLDLVAEWPTSHGCAAAQVDNLRDEYGPVVKDAATACNDNGKPKFKVGDRVRVITKRHGDTQYGKTGTVTEAERTCYSEFDIEIRYDEPLRSLTSNQYTSDDLELVALATPAIVALIDNGQPKPADRPHVHPSRGAACNEADRLARVHPGKEFGVYELVDTRQVAKPDYEHEWQKLARLPWRRERAIEALMRHSGIGRGPASVAVDRLAYGREA